MNFVDNPLKTPNEWIGSADEPLKGFSWKKGTVPDTDGLVVWSDVFLHTAEDGTKFAIILADTQGLFRVKVS